MSDEIHNVSNEIPGFSGIVRLLESKDLVDLKPVLEEWIKDRDTGNPLPTEVEKNLQVMSASIGGGTDYTYFVATQVDGKAIGVIGMRPPEEKMMALDFLKTDKPVELINAYVSSFHRAGKGVGSSLVRKLEGEAIQRGFTEVVLNSGPRYKATGWGFYDKQPGYNRVGVAISYYGPGGDAPVWKKSLVD